MEKNKLIENYTKEQALELFKKITLIVQETPNDMDLGKSIRKIFFVDIETDSDND